MVDLGTHFRLLADYNRGANEALYDACARLTESDLHRRRPAFFHSIHGTLNHILVGDRIWMARFESEVVPSTGLDAILHDSFVTLRAARRAEDDRIAAFVAGLDAEALEGDIAYVNNAGHACRDPVVLLVAHLFNHQTHHRGQVHDMLSQTDVAPPSLDMHRIVRPIDGPRPPNRGR